MKKVFAFVGSSMGEKSGTALFVRKIAEKTVEKYQRPIEFDIITADQANINPCKGCCNCFRYCECPQDKYDDAAVIKRKMLEADFVLWGSPVYAHQVSGQMKTLIDRISYWLHLLPLAGKPGIVVTTTSSSGHMEVLSYLTKIMFYTGAKAVGGYSVLTRFQGSFLDILDAEKKAESAAKIISSYLSEEKKVTSNSVLETIFQALKQSIACSKEEKPGEFAFWEKKGYFACQSFGELLDRKS